MVGTPDGDSVGVNVGAEEGVAVGSDVGVLVDGAFVGIATGDPVQRPQICGH